MFKVVELPSDRNASGRGFGEADLALLKEVVDSGTLICISGTQANHFEEDLKRGIENPGEPRWPDDKQYTLFGDTIEEMSTWYGFSEKYKEDQDRRRQAREGRSSHSQSALNLYKNVGRNDPCPCGSGKKFKKCCLH